jgi:hypothetical protein
MKIYLTKEFEDAYDGNEEPDEELDEYIDEDDTSHFVSALLDLVLALIEEDDECYDEEVVESDEDEDEYYIMTVEQADKYRKKEDGRVYIATFSKE